MGELIFADFLVQTGIQHQFSCIKSPQQNAVVEHKHKSLLNVARVVFFQSKVPSTFLEECVLTITHLINRLSSPTLRNKYRLELLTGNLPLYNHLYNFGCLCFISTLMIGQHKCDTRSFSIAFVGNPYGIKGYKVYNLQFQKICISHDEVFQESVFPFHHLKFDSGPIDFFFDS